jgi:hypothetical protein
MLTDGLAYDKAGVARMVNLAKAHALPTLPAAMSCTGPAILSPLIAENIANEFSSFDDLVERANEWLPQMFNQVAEKYRDGDAASSLYLVGWHEKRGCPAAYAVDLWTDKSTMIGTVLGNSRNAANVQRSKLLRQSTIAGTPLDPGLIERSGFTVRPNDDYVPELDLLHIAEVARHERIEGAYWVGGLALLTSIDATGVRQRVIHRWKEDNVGQKITPVPIPDWQAWRAARTASNTVQTVDFSGMSRLKREMMQRKARKANR